MKKNKFFIAGLLILISILTPYLFIIFTSPQYPTRSPKMYLYTHTLKGDIKDWEVLGRYIGINVQPHLPEFDYKIIVIILILVSSLCILANFKSMKVKKTAALILIITGLGLAVWAQFRLYQQGHNLDPNAPLKYAVKPFTPPLIGITKVSKIKIYHLPHIGSLLYVLAVVLTGYEVWVNKSRG